MFKTLLLGSTAALLMVGGASAADLTTAEPVDYVKVCDAFGKGYFYSPGTDTCIKIGGYVKFKTQASGGDGLDSVWGAFYTEASIQVTASSVTEYGNLTGYYELRTRSGSSYARSVSSGDTTTYIKNAYLQLGGLKAGHFTSFFDFGRGYTDTGMFGSDVETDHIQYTYALGSLGLTVSVEDSTDRDRSGIYGNNSAAPDLQAGLTYAAGPGSYKLIAAYVPNQIDGIDSGWAIGGSAEFTLDQFNKGDKFVVNAAYGDNAPSYTGLIGGTSLLGSNKGNTASYEGNSWSVLASYKHAFSDQVWGALSAGYLDSDSYGNAWRTAVNVDWAPVKGFDVLAEGLYQNADYNDTTWQANLFLKRSW